MIRHRDINKIQAIILMQRLYGYLLLLKYIQLLANYDNNGNLTQRKHKTTQLATTYTYDYENRLIKINLPLGITAEYKYDPFGRRIEKNIGNQITVKYLYDNEDIIMEYATVIPTNSTITTKYIHGPGIDEPLSILRNNKTYYYHADALGSITRMTDQNGNTVQTIKYDSFGNIKSISNPFLIQPYAYTGREFDMETGFYYLRNRYYDPKTGRFISKDPIGFAGGINFYSYVNNRPTRFVDPLGLLEMCPWKLPDYIPLLPDQLKQPKFKIPYTDWLPGTITPWVDPPNISPKEWLKPKDALEKIKDETIFGIKFDLRF